MQATSKTKLLFTFLLLCCFGIKLYSQDIIIKTDSSKIYCNIIWLDSNAVYYSRFNYSKEQSIAKEKVWVCFSYSKGLLYENKKFIATLGGDEELDSSLIVKDSIYIKSTYDTSSIHTDVTKQPPVNLAANLIQNEGNAYYYQGEKLTTMQLKRIMAGNNEASEELKQALNKRSDYRVFTFLGACTLGAGAADIATYSTLKAGNLTAGIILTGIGIGFCIPSYVERHSIYKRIHKAVTIYNTQISESNNR